MDTISPRYRSAKLLVFELASRRFLIVSRMIPNMRDTKRPRSIFFGDVPELKQAVPGLLVAHLDSLIAYSIGSSVTSMLLTRYPEDIDKFTTAWGTI